MSRIGKMPIELPDGVSADIKGQTVEIKGPKGTLKRDFSDKISITLEDGVIKVARQNNKPEQRSLHGLTRALINNMVVGVTDGFEKQLTLIGVGYRAAMNGNKLALTVGKSHPVEMDPGPELTVTVPQPNTIVVWGISKEKVGAFAANVREVRPPEPYKGKGIKYADEYIRRKAGKAGVKEG